MSVSLTRRIRDLEKHQNKSAVRKFLEDCAKRTLDCRPWEKRIASLCQRVGLRKPHLINGLPVLDDVAFFLEHGGYSNPPGRVASAVELAEAERAADKADAYCKWELDLDGDASFVDDWPSEERKEWKQQEHECLSCTLCDKDGMVLASLCGIWDPTDDFRRVVEAELAQEALGSIEADSA